MVKVPIWEPNISDLPGASKTPHATAEAFGLDIAKATSSAGANIAAGINTLGDALTAQANEQDAISAKVAASDHETAVNMYKLNLENTTPAEQRSSIPDMVQQFANDDWNQRRGSIGGKYQSMADAQVRQWWNRSYYQNQVGAVKDYQTSVAGQVDNEVKRQGMLVFADPNNVHAASGAIGAYITETNLPPEMKRQMLVAAAGELQSQIIAGYKLRIQNAAALGNVTEAVRLQGEAAQAAARLPGQLTELLGINRLPVLPVPQAIVPGAPVSGPYGGRPAPPPAVPGKRSEAAPVPQTTQQLASMQEVKPGTTPMQIASQLVGAHEITNRGVISDFISKAIGRRVDPAVSAWCAAFVNAVLRRSGEPGTDSMAARSFLNYGTPVAKPQVGDIVVFSRGPGHGHVGFFAGGNPDGSIKVLGGNQGNMVSIKTFGTDRVIGYRRVGSPARTQAASVEE